MNSSDEEIENIDVEQFNKMTSIQKVKVLDGIESVSLFRFFKLTKKRSCVL